MKTEKKNYVDFKNLLKLIFIFLLFYFSNLFKYIPIKLLGFDTKHLSANTELLLSLFCSLCNLILLLIIYRKDFLLYAKKIRKNLFQTIDECFKYYIFGVFGMVVTNLILSFLFQGDGANNEKIVQEMISVAPYLMLINAGIIAPIIEEITFRKAYLDAFHSKWLFVLTSGIVFGLMHVITSANSLIEYLYFIPYSSLGIALAYMDWKEDNVLPSIFVHIFHNTVLVLIAIFIR